MVGLQPGWKKDSTHTEQRYSRTCNANARVRLQTTFLRRMSVIARFRPASLTFSARARGMPCLYRPFVRMSMSTRLTYAVWSTAQRRQPILLHSYLRSTKFLHSPDVLRIVS